MEVLVAKKCGFCPGVKNAIMLARKTLAEHKKVCSLGPIIHNEDIVRELAQAGLETVESVDQVESGTILVRSHGATKEQIQLIEGKKLQMVDATCVLVKRVQKIAHELHEDGYKVVIIGDKNHPEVQAVIGFAEAEDVVVIGSEGDLRNLSGHMKLGVICQTTQSPDHFRNILAKIIQGGFSELKVVNTLCRETIKRQESAVKLCKQVDIMFVLGGLNSANTKKLAELCKKHNNQTFHLQNWSELDKSILCGKCRAGVTAGASTPDRVIREFVENLKSIDTSSCSDKR